MTLSIRVVWVLVAGLGLLCLAPASWKWIQASRAESMQVARLARLTSQAASINELRGKLPEWALSSTGGGALAPEVSAVLSAAGLPPSAMASLVADPETNGSGGSAASGGSVTGSVQARTRRATLVLGSVTLPQLGAFFQQWRERQPTWTVATIDVTPEIGSPAMAARMQTGGDLPLRAVLTMEHLSLQRSGGGR